MALSMEHDKSIAEIGKFPLTIDSLHNEAMALESKDIRKAILYHSKAAELGNPTSQHFYADALATGVMGVPPDEAKAILMDVFAAHNGDPGAASALGYRYFYGLGVPQDCSKALKFYSLAAEHAVERSKAKKAWPSKERLRLSTIALQGKKSQNELDSEIVQHYEHLAETGNSDALRILGTFSQYGLRGMQQDLRLARKFMSRAAHSGDELAIAPLGKMYLYGIGGDVDEELALEFFKQSDEKPDGLAGLCHMHLHGLAGLSKNRNKAKMLCGLAVEISQVTDQAHADALHTLGDILSGADIMPPELFSGMEENTIGWQLWREAKSRHNVDGNDLTQALKHYLMASKSGVVGHFDALFKAARMYQYGEGTIKDCPTAVTTFSMVAAQGETSRLVLKAQELYLKGDLNGAMIHYARAAETGDELSQSNAAWLLEHGVCNDLPQKECENAALRFYERASRHDNGYSHLKIGDYLYYGKGKYLPDLAGAVRAYRRAADRRVPQALFNLGWMHAVGLGVKQDFMLAKRHYTQAVEINDEAKYPVQLGLLEMYARIYIQRWYSALASLRLNMLQYDHQIWGLTLAFTLVLILLVHFVVMRRRN